jgi:hypothetical protein
MSPSDILYLSIHTHLYFGSRLFIFYFHRSTDEGEFCLPMSLEHACFILFRLWGLNFWSDEIRDSRLWADARMIKTFGGIGMRRLYFARGTDVKLWRTESKLCGKQNNSTRTQEYCHFTWQKELCRCYQITDLEMRNLSWIIEVGAT